MTSDDPYRRCDYRRSIAWPARIRREAPVLRELLESGPNRRVLDLGCGTGEHVRALAELGFEAVGVDRSPSMLAQARAGGESAGVTFVEADLRDLEGRLEPGFGGAVCLGNVLPHLREEADLERFCQGARAVLAAGAPLLLQVLNYEGIRLRGERALPVNVRPAEDGAEIVFLRLMQTRPDGSVAFFPSTLELRPDEDPPLRVVRSQKVELRGWTRSQLQASLERAGFPETRAWGDFARSPFVVEASRDLILLAR